MNFLKNIFNKNNDTPQTKALNNKFTAYFTANEPCLPITDDLLETYATKVPPYLVSLWKNYGFGNFNNGLIELVNPKDFESSLSTWLGREIDNYVPFAISGFGELFYYRKLTDTDEDVCMIDIQYRNIEVVEWSLESFFEEVLTHKTSREEWLRESLFKKAVAKYGALSTNKVFTIVPMLALGGSLETKNLKKGNPQAYQNIVFQATM
uniref:T6SS immunity protein Tdi1 domain-containing protein n=1 Tax=uncultured Tenacibaculum sp. TaxID=174713 RepID=UPI0026278287|nr:T6SS immunity protein Tdi1 domain-containing protein [uncultured Tenacibaculum sp.]